MRLSNVIHQNNLFEQNVHPTINQRTSALKVFLENNLYKPINFS